MIIAELRRAKRTREAPWVRKNGNSSSRENLVMTSAYERESERASERANAVRTDSGGGGGASRGKPHGGSKEMSSFLVGVCQKFVFVVSVHDRGR